MVRRRLVLFAACLVDDLALGWRFMLVPALVVCWVVFVEALANPQAVVYASQTYGVDLAPWGVLCFLFQGTQPVTQGQAFVVPLSWLTLLLAVAFASFAYPAHSLSRRRSAQILLRSSKGAWWCSKLAWSVFAWCTMVAVLLGISTLAGVFVSKTPLGVDLGGVSLSGASAIEASVLFALVAMSVFAIALIASVLGLLVGAVAVTIGVSVFLVLSAYSAQAFFFANYAMLERINDGWVPFCEPLLFASGAACALLVAAAAGFMAFARRDIH